jgi:hypothetical protein
MDCVMKDGFEFTFDKKRFACSAAPAVPVLVAPCFTCATVNRESSVANNATGHFSSGTCDFLGQASDHSIESGQQGWKTLRRSPGVLPSPTTSDALKALPIRESVPTSGPIA